MNLKLVIANKNNVNDLMKEQKERYAVIGISNPYPDPIDYFTYSGKFRGILKIEFEDSNPSVNHDHKLLFNEKKRDSILKFIEAMILSDIHTFIIHCDKGRHRSVAVAMKIRDLYDSGRDKVEILNLPENPNPNEHVAGMFV